MAALMEAKPEPESIDWKIGNYTYLTDKIEQWKAAGITPPSPHCIRYTDCPADRPYPYVPNYWSFPMCLNGAMDPVESTEADIYPILLDCPMGSHATILDIHDKLDIHIWEARDVKEVQGIGASGAAGVIAPKPFQYDKCALWMMAVFLPLIAIGIVLIVVRKFWEIRRAKKMEAEAEAKAEAGELKTVMA